MNSCTNRDLERTVRTEDGPHARVTQLWWIDATDRLSLAFSASELNWNPARRRAVGIPLPTKRQPAGWVRSPQTPSVKDMTTIAAHEHGVSPAPSHGDGRAYRPSLIRQLAIDTAYVLVGFPLGVVTFVIVITGLSVGLGLLITLLGIPILVATLFTARGFAELERARITSVLHLPRLRVRYKKADPTANAWRRPFSTLSDIQAWLDFLHGFVRFPIAVTGFTIVVTWWACALGGLTYGLWDWALPHNPDNYELPELLGFQDTAQTRIGFYLIVGVLFTITLPYVVRGCALAEAWVARGLLTGVAALRNQVADLEVGQATAEARTAAAVSAEATALRRLERDIHDGPQQRLVRLAIDLGRAKHQIATDPAAATITVDEALAQAREALDELRTLSRGIAPPILTDRGLVSAVAALAARATVPVSLDTGEPVRLDPLAEQTAYFAIAEALTNVCKHSDATRATISIRVSADRLTAGVFDDGRGGAHLSKGHGLAGLADRLHAAGGQLWVSSPAGGPTSITVELTVPDRPLRLVLADDAVLLREGLVRLLTEQGHDVVAVVGDGPSLVEAAALHQPDVSIVDVRMPPSHTDEGLRAAVEVRAARPGAPVLVLSQYVELSYASDLLADRRGSIGYLLKDRVADIAEFLEALSRVADGGTVLDPEVVGQLLVRRQTNDPLEALTPREREVLALMAEGRSNTAIARQMVVSEGAVEKHVRNIFNKLDLPPDDELNRRVLAVLAFLRG